MIDFKPIRLTDKQKYEEYLSASGERGCEYSFANLYCWGEQKIAFIHGHAAIFSRFGKNFIYPCPVGNGDKKAVFDAIIADSKERGIRCCISGLRPWEKEILEELYGESFEFSSNNGSFDYVYAIDNLADLGGKKYHGKRNHINRFRERYPDCAVSHIGPDNIACVRKMADEWYDYRIKEAGTNDFVLEQKALEKALCHHKSLGLESVVLQREGRVLAFTMGSRLSNETFDVHFEKASHDIDGGYTAVNCEFAKYIREKYPEVRFIDREEDMGIEGLRKAKQSYHPHHMVEKFKAVLLSP